MSAELSKKERLTYYSNVCKSLGLNPLASLDGLLDCYSIDEPKISKWKGWRKVSELSDLNESQLNKLVDQIHGKCGESENE